MPKTKQDKELYSRLREGGVRKKVARELTGLPSHAESGQQAPQALRKSVERLETTVAELREQLGQGDRKAAARKAARTRQAKQKKRSASARNASRRRAKS